MLRSGRGGAHGGGARGRGGAPSSEEASTTETQGNEGLVVYMKNLPFDVPEEGVRAFFTDCGEFSMEFDTNERGRFAGTGSLTFKTKEQAAKAVELSGQDLGGRAIATSLDPSFKPAGCTTVFVGGLPADASDEDISAHFASCGNVIRVSIAYDENGESRGFAHVEFDASEATDAAVSKMEGSDLKNSSLRVSYAAGRRGGGGRGGGRGDRGFRRGGPGRGGPGRGSRGRGAGLGAFAGKKVVLDD